MDRALENREKAQLREILKEYKYTKDEVNKLLLELDKKYKLEYEQLIKYNRLDKVEEEITKEIGKLTSKNAVKTTAALKQQYEEAYYRTAFIAERTAQVKLRYTILNPNTIKRAIENPLDRVGWKTRNRENQQRLARQVKEQIVQGLIQGKAYRDIAEDITDRFDVGATNIDRIVRTETHRVQNQGRHDSFDHAEKMGVQIKKIWVATLDDRVRDRHAFLDGKEADKDGLFYADGFAAEYPGGFGDPANDINCRCTIRAEIVGYEPEVRRIREEKDVVPYKTYEEWKGKRL